MNIDNLTLETKKELFNRIVDSLNDKIDSGEINEIYDDILEDMIERLDEYDEEDYFGTEGWRKFLNLENFSLYI